MMSVTCFVLLAGLCIAWASPRICNTECKQAAFEKSHAESLRRILHEKRSDSLSKYKSNPRRTSPPNQDDLQALTSFYKSTGGANWTKNDGWKEGVGGSPCDGENQWYGVSCDGNNRVIAIELVYNNLDGKLPSDLIRASRLEHLVLYSNSLKGAIPEGIFQLANLIQLDVNNNQMAGELPVSISAPNLQSLVLYTNAFNGPLPVKWNTPRLQYLEASDNNFTGPVPEAIGDATELLQLVVSRNNLSGSFPSSWGQLTKLNQLWSFNNEIHGPLPESWSNLKMLLNVEMDGVTGSFPDWLGTSWTKVENLLLPRSNMTGMIPESICHMKRLEYLWLFQNDFSGNIPNCMGEMTKLQSLELSDNQLSGSIPDSLGSLFNISYLYLSRNKLTGPLPASLSGMKVLQVLDVSSNMLTGGIPSSYDAFTDCVYLFSVCYNSLSGPVSSSLERFFKFIDDFTCDMYGNPWSCPLPAVVPKSCGCSCSKCNSGAKRESCQQCVGSQGCGFCSNGPNCLEGSAGGPQSGLECPSGQWKYGNC